MSFEIIPTPNFFRELKRLAKRYTPLKTDFLKLIQAIKENPFQGIELFKSCHKIRFAIKSKGKGKSGGGRLITHLIVSEKKVFLLHVYDKSENEYSVGNDEQNQSGTRTGFVNYYITQLSYVIKFFIC